MSNARAASPVSLHGTGEAARATGDAPIRATPYVWRDPTTIPRREWLYGRHLVRKYLSCTLAAGGLGKSSLALVEAVAMATGRNLLGHPVRTPLRVWYYNLEDPTEEIDRRIGAILLHYRIDAAELGGRLFRNSGRDCALVIARQHRGDTVVAEPVVAGLKRAFLADGIDAAIFDPFVRTHAVDENSSTPIDTVCGAFKEIADETNAAIELIHHVRKANGGEVRVEDGRGSGAIKDACRSVRVLNGMTKEEGERAGVERHEFYFRADIGKSNLLPSAHASDWHRLNSVPLGNDDLETGEEGDKVGVVAKWTWPDALAEVTVDNVRQVQDAVAAGRWRENQQAADWVGKPIAKVLDVDLDTKAGKTKIVRLVKIWLASAVLVAVEGEDAKRNKRTFVEVGDRV